MIEKLLSNHQKNEIVEIIKSQCRLFQEYEIERDSLFYKPYTHMRQKHSVTSAILSGFAPDRFQIEGIKVVDLNYGLRDKLVQPELQCEMGLFHIYSNGSDLKGAKILERCKELNKDIETAPVFFLIIVSADKSGVLQKIDIYLPDDHGRIIRQERIYETPKLKAITA